MGPQTRIRTLFGVLFFCLIAVLTSLEWSGIGVSFASWRPAEHAKLEPARDLSLPHEPPIAPRFDRAKSRNLLLSPLHPLDEDSYLRSPDQPDKSETQSSIDPDLFPHALDFVPGADQSQGTTSALPRLSPRSGNVPVEELANNSWTPPLSIYGGISNPPDSKCTTTQDCRGGSDQQFVRISEPASLALLLVGFGALIWNVRRSAG
jgi:hypothetical protein